MLLGTLGAYYWFQMSPGSMLPPATPPSKVSQPANRLALGMDAKADTVSIALNAPAEFDLLPKAVIVQQRHAAALQHPELLSSDYQPLEAVFGQIIDGAPWWGIEGQFYYGPGTRSIEGPSEESRFLLNPYLLLAPEFSDWWKDEIAEADVARFPLTCLPQQLTWHPRQAQAEVTYDAACILGRQNPTFDLIAYNARDMGLTHIYVSYGDSVNVSKSNPPSTAYANPQFIHRGGSCGYPGGCNNMSPMTPDIDGIQLDGLPATVVVWLWAGPPRSIVQAPDMKFSIHFR